MNIDSFNGSIYWNLKEIVESYEKEGKIDFGEIDIEIEEMLYSLEDCLLMINCAEKISDVNYYNMLKGFAYISNWSDYDYYRVIEIANNQTYKAIGTIMTTMHSKYIKNEGRGRDFGYYNVETGINFRILYTEDAKIDFGHFYTIEEITRLIEEKRIVIICEEERNLSYDDEYVVEEYYAFDCVFNDNVSRTISEINNYEFFHKDGKFYEYTLKYIKQTVDRKELLKIFKEYLGHVNGEINSVIKAYYGNDGAWGIVCGECTKEFNDKGYVKRLQRLNSFKSDE